MSSSLQLYNSLSRKKERFEPISPPFVGLYVCGPTVYGEPHLGHARAAITFDVVFRYLKHKGYKVRYVRNITDVGHLVDDADSGEDKIAKKAKLEALEPMEVVHLYTNKYHEAMLALNNLSPSIEPCASGHIQEQIKMVEDIEKAGYAYEVDGSVYFDVVKYNEDHHYGKLSGRIIEDMMASERDLDGQEIKKNKVDFALWKKASPEHIMRWESPWSIGFPGWHLECSTMSTKYLGKTFDIHGGGMDLLFPHHECEIAQSVASNGNDPVKYWMHNNMITLNGQKMGKSLGNAINLEEFFTGDHPLLERGYGPMTIRFFMLQTHYRSTLDFSNEALQAAEKGYKRLMNASKVLLGLEYVCTSFDGQLDEEVNNLCDQCDEFMDDDLNTAVVLANLFELSSKINAFKDGILPVGAISEQTFGKLKSTYHDYIFNVLGLKEEGGADDQLTDDLVQLLIELRKQARDNKDFATSDQIRDQLLNIGVQLKDGKEGTTWSIEN